MDNAQITVQLIVEEASGGGMPSAESGGAGGSRPGRTPGLASDRINASWSSHDVQDLRQMLRERRALKRRAEAERLGSTDQENPWSAGVNLVSTLANTAPTLSGVAKGFHSAAEFAAAIGVNRIAGGLEMAGRTVGRAAQLVQTVDTMGYLLSDVAPMLAAGSLAALGFSKDWVARVLKSSSVLDTTITAATSAAKTLLPAADKARRLGVAAARLGVAEPELLPYIASVWRTEFDVQRKRLELEAFLQRDVSRAKVYDAVAALMAATNRAANR